MASDILIGAGCVGQVTGAWVGNVSGGLGHNYRRAAEKGEPRAIRIRDYSNLSLGMALAAGATGLAYAPMRTLLGSDIPRSNPELKFGIDPFDGGAPVVLVPPITPGVAILPVQRADRFGNCHFWGSSGVAKEAALASGRVIVLADEIVEPDVIASDPGRVLVPGFRVAAVCHVPAAVHPSPLTGAWRRDNEFFHEYHTASREPDGFRAWLDEWVIGTGDHDGYRAKLGARLDALRIRGKAPAAPVNYADK
jgi:glutaconate CoA-transferase subunit A